MKPTYPPGGTPLDPDWARDLIPSLTLMSELNELEEQNILAALRWGLTRARLAKELLTVDGLRRLHRRMFDEVWRWAGAFRTRDLNLGSEWVYIPERVRALCGDAEYWLEHRTYERIELAVRFHHRLVAIHPFFNGNGRHARLASDLLLAHHGEAMLPWGGATLATASEVRDVYIAALRAADRGDLRPLVTFATSG